MYCFVFLICRIVLWLAFQGMHCDNISCHVNALIDEKEYPILLWQPQHRCRHQIHHSLGSISKSNNEIWYMCTSNNLLRNNLFLTVTAKHKWSMLSCQAVVDKISQCLKSSIYPELLTQTDIYLILTAIEWEIVNNKNEMLSFVVYWLVMVAVYYNHIFE